MTPPPKKTNKKTTTKKKNKNNKIQTHIAMTYFAVYYIQRRYGYI
jgi:hypothetical protein